MAHSAEEIEQAVKQLPMQELKKFRAWYAKFDAACWDEEIEQDMRSGGLDALADSAIADHEAGKSRKL